MTSKQYNVNVSFTVGATSGWDAMEIVLETLRAAEMTDQLPEWEIVDAEELLAPDDTYARRMTDGETTP